MHDRSTRGTLIRSFAAITLLGCFAAVVTDIVAILVRDSYNPVSQSISALAVGRYGWIQDIGLYLLAAGVASLAAAFLRWKARGAGWLFGCVLLFVIAGDVALIAALNQYAGTKNVGADIHQWAFYGLGALVAAAALILAAGLKELSTTAGRATVVFGLCWIVLAPCLFLVPSGWLGAYERFLALLAIGWLIAASLLLRRRIA